MTPTRRLAHYLRARHDAASVAAGLQAWPSPDIATWTELVRRAFDADREAGRTTCRWLEPAQATLVWEQIIRADERLHSVIAPAGIGAMALRSWTLQHDYLVPAETLDTDSSPEVQAFAQWRAEYVRWLRRGQWRDAAEASGCVGVPVGTTLVLAGFDVLTPAQQAFFARVVAAGVVVQGLDALVGDSIQASGEDNIDSGAVDNMVANVGERIVANVPKNIAEHVETTTLADPRVITCNDFDDEVETAARWAALRLHQSPHERIAIIVRGLGQQRQRVRRILDRVLAPAVTVTGGAAPESMVYELAAARPLVEQPVVAAMLAWLTALVTETSFATCSALLRSAFDRSAATEAHARAELDAWLRRHEPAELSLARLGQHAARRECTVFAASLQQGLARATDWSRRRVPSQWVREISSLAQELGWPGANADSAEHQATQRWQTLLGEFGASDDVTGPISVAAALSHLRELATTALFEPQEIKAPLVVIDPDTSAGMQFDAAWVVGLEATHWPAPASPDPFLPRDAQLRAGIPGASAEQSVATARRTLRRLQRDCRELFLSVPSFEDDAPLLPSPLVLGFERAAKPGQWPGQDVATTAFAMRPELERLVDGSLPAIAAHHVAPGGTKLVELQGACPFRAAVELRLGGRELAEPAPGINSSERGNVVHAVLKSFWDEVRGHKRLAAMTRGERLALVRGFVARHLAPLRAAASEVRLHLLELEDRWLETRVMELLDVDLARPAFSVEHTELAANIDVGGLQVRLQLDRVDRLGDATLAVIDYKTGAVASPNDWMGERPRAPQLPLYVRAVGAHDVSAVAFARVRTGATAYTGYVRDLKLFTGLVGFAADKKPFQEYASWDELLAAWGRRLDRLGEEFGAGDARLAPDPARACKRCHLPGLCRIGEIEGEDVSEVADD